METGKTTENGEHQGTAGGGGGSILVFWKNVQKHGKTGEEGGIVMFCAACCCYCPNNPVRILISVMSVLCLFFCICMFSTMYHGSFCYCMARGKFCPRFLSH